MDRKAFFLKNESEKDAVVHKYKEDVLKPGSSMKEMIDAVWDLPRDIVSDGFDKALNILAGQVPMSIHEYATGTECFTWFVPEKWTCREAHVETLDGRRIFSYADCPLHVVSYSLPFQGIVSKESLWSHLHVHDLIEDAVPFMTGYYERDWGLCCSKRQRDALTEDRYMVKIDTEFRDGCLKVGEVVIPGKVRSLL